MDVIFNENFAMSYARIHTTTQSLGYGGYPLTDIRLLYANARKRMSYLRTTSRQHQVRPRLARDIPVADARRALPKIAMVKDRARQHHGGEVASLTADVVSQDSHGQGSRRQPLSGRQDSADTLSQDTATQTERNSEVTSRDTKAKIKLWHARLGGVGFERLKELGKLYPKLVQIPLTATFDEVCRCCQRSSMRKCNAAGEITRLPKPLEEIHFDIFTYDSTFTLFLIDRGSRVCWAYQLPHKSDVPRALQQFIIDCATNDFPVGRFVFTAISTRNQGIDAQAINAYLEHHGLHQRVKIFFADNAGEHQSHDLEDFITQLNILHLSSIAGSQYQNALAENAGGWRLGDAICHDFDMSGLSSAFLYGPVNLPCPARTGPRQTIRGGVLSERELFIGTQFSNLYTAQS
jgi:hypothetical protein